MRERQLKMILQYSILSVLILVLLFTSYSFLYKSHELNNLPRKVMNNTQINRQNLLNDLDRIYKNIGINEQSKEGVNNSEFQKLEKELPFKIPQDVQELYKWHNGVEQFIPAFEFLSLQDAVADYKRMIKFENEMKNDERFWKDNYLPILQFDDSFLVAECNSRSDTKIYSVWLEGSYTAKEYESIDQMLQIIVDAYISGAYYMNYNYLDENVILLQRVKRKYLSDEQINQIDLRWQELSQKASHPPQTKLERQSLIRMLGESSEERAISYLLNFLNDENPEVIASAAFALGQLKARESLPELVRLLKHPSEIVRNLSAVGIEEIATSHDEILLEPLLNLLKDKELLVRMSAVQALGQIKSKKALLPLTQLLQDEKSIAVQYQIIQTLGKTVDISSIKVLNNFKKQMLALDPGTYRGGSRGSDVSPGQMIFEIDQALKFIEKANSI